MSRVFLVSHCPSKGAHTRSQINTGSAMCVSVCVGALIHLREKGKNTINSLAQSVFFPQKRINQVQSC